MCPEREAAMESMKLSLYLCTLCFLVLTRVQGQTHPRLAELTSVGDYVHVSGVWIPDVRTKESKLVPAVMDYSCYRHGGTEFAGSDAFCLEVTATPVTGTIHIDTNFLKVIAWTKTVIETTTDNGDPDHLPCAISEVTFNLGLKSVTAVDRKKPVANRIDLCKGMLDHVSYALYDKVEYSLFGEPK
jgi:hypothetical protein